MGTGYATLALNYNPADLRDYILELLKTGDSSKTFVPWYKGFKGKIYRNEKQTIFEGLLEVKNTTTIEISELPVGYYQADFKHILNKLEEEGFIKDYDDYSTENEFKFIVTTPRSTTMLDKDELMKKFKLISRETENLTFWTEDGRIKVFDDVYQIVNHFVVHRLEKYEERRIKLISNTEELLRKREERKRFIEFYLANSNEFKNKKKSDLFDWLVKNEFENPDPLLQLPIYSLTRDRIDDLNDEIVEIKKHLSELNTTNNVEMYIKELNGLKLN
jgi:DNA topoisomerase-2